MKKILIIAGDFIPYSPSLGGVIRILTLSEFLIRNGFEVHIITSKSKFFGYFGYEESLKKISVHYIENRIQSYIFKSTADKKKYLDDKGYGKAKKGRLIKRLTTGIKYRMKNIVLEFCVPDINIFMKDKFVKKAVELIKNEDIANLLISSPPHSMQVVGTKLKKYFGNKINYIADYRDSWNTIRLFSKNNFISKTLSRHYEKKALCASDFFTFISDPMLPKVEKLYSIDIKYKSRLVMNGFIEEINGNSKKQNNNKIIIGYFGAISDSKNSMRDISKMLDLLEKKPGLSDKLEFHFYGDVTISNHDPGKIPMVKVSGSLDHKDALKEMLAMDYLLLVHSDRQSSDEVITGKFFEYVAARKPVLCLGPEDMEARRLVTRYNLGINIDIFNEDDMFDKLRSLQDIDPGKFYGDIDINIFKRDVQYEKFLGLLR